LVRAKPLSAGGAAIATALSGGGADTCVHVAADAINAVAVGERHTQCVLLILSGLAEL
jgi:hypothetical protein